MEEIAVGQFRERIKQHWEARKAAFKRIEQITDIAALSKEDREKYDESIRIYRDTLAVMECEREKGWNEGYAEGFEIGRAEALFEVGVMEERIKNARSMKSLGLGADVISQVTGLSAADIEAL